MIKEHYCKSLYLIMYVQYIYLEDDECNTFQIFEKNNNAIICWCSIMRERIFVLWRERERWGDGGKEKERIVKE